MTFADDRRRFPSDSPRRSVPLMPGDGEDPPPAKPVEEVERAGTGGAVPGVEKEGAEAAAAGSSSGETLGAGSGDGKVKEDPPAATPSIFEYEPTPGAGDAAPSGQGTGAQSDAMEVDGEKPQELTEGEKPKSGSSSAPAESGVAETGPPEQSDGGGESGGKRAREPSEGDGEKAGEGGEDKAAAQAVVGSEQVSTKEGGGEDSAPASPAKKARPSEEDSPPHREVEGEGQGRGDGDRGESTNRESGESGGGAPKREEAEVDEEEAAAATAREEKEVHVDPSGLALLVCSKGSFQVP